VRVKRKLAVKKSHSTPLHLQQESRIGLVEEERQAMSL